ncbi:hypothetical protein CcaverHIS002_0607780 [Cutaneotrichosporon cavernicola]|nr:hypothetical protein CcaverHIS002_0607780 [Cutaneotrichosporon cavernicola]
MSRPINTHSPPRASASRPRINALSPLQTFSSLSPESDVIKTKSWAVSTSPQSITPSSLSRSGSANSLSRSLSGRDFAFTSRRGTNSSDVSDTTTRLLLVKAPSSPDQPLRKSSQSCSSLASVAVSASSPPQPARKRSFAGASFGGMSPISPMTTLRREASNPDLTATQITPTGGLVGVGTGLTQLQNAPQLSPEEIMGLGRGIMAPVAASDSGSVTPGRNRRRPLRPNWKDIDVHEWNWSEFYAHLTTVDRAECEDYPWVELARDAVRQHSVSLWENLGTCLGCDTELMMAGEEDETPASWGGLGLSEEGEYDPYQRRVWIEGLEPVDPDAEMREERELSEAFDDYEFGAAGGFSSMATIGEERPAPSGPTPAQRAGKGEVTDPLRSPEARNHPLAHDFAMASSASSASSLGSVGSPVSSSGGPKRGRSFVGLSITTSAPTFAPRTPGSYEEREDQQQRTPGNPLFVSSFNTLSLSPTLGRKQSRV